MNEERIVYILASKRNGTLYTGVTSDLKARIWQHKNKTIPGFTAKYNIGTLVHFEQYEDYWIAANRERCIKEWKRQWKIELIEKNNPEWRDLYDEL